MYRASAACHPESRLASNPVIFCGAMRTFAFISAVSAARPLALLPWRQKSLKVLKPNKAHHSLPAKGPNRSQASHYITSIHLRRPATPKSTEYSWAIPDAVQGLLDFLQYIIMRRCSSPHSIRLARVYHMAASRTLWISKNYNKEYTGNRSGLKHPWKWQR